MEKYDNFNEALAESVSATTEDAREFLIEEGKDPDAIVQRGLELIKSLQPPSGIPLDENG